MAMLNNQRVTGTKKNNWKEGWSTTRFTRVLITNSWFGRHPLPIHTPYWNLLDHQVVMRLWVKHSTNPVRWSTKDDCITHVYGLHVQCIWGMADVGILMLIHGNDLINDTWKLRSMDHRPSRYQLLDGVSFQTMTMSGLCLRKWRHVTWWTYNTYSNKNRVTAHIMANLQ